MARLSNSSQLSLSLDNAFTNRGLFADHFLKNRLTQMQEWQNAPDMDGAFQTVLKLYRDKGANMSEATNEAQTEDDFVKPVLNALWWRDCYQIQVNLPNPDGRGQPDYALFTSQAARDGAENLKGKLAYWGDVAVVGDAKKWRDPLDKARKGETPGAQISRYLFQTNRRWGILTNGPIWRLYEQDKARQGGIYFEANLEHILKTEDKDAFKQFALFFGRDSFAPRCQWRLFCRKSPQGQHRIRCGCRRKP